MPDFSAYRRMDCSPLSELSNCPISDIGRFYLDILPRFVYLPHAQVQLPILASLALIPSALATRHLPVVFLCGRQGTGKSTVLEVMGYLHRATLLNSSSTYASLRDSIQINKYAQKDGGTEDNTILLVDNVLGDTFDDPGKYALFLGGYDRKTSKIRLSGGLKTDAPMEFDTFGVKVISSVLPLHLDERYSELQRRLLVIFTTGLPKGHPIHDTMDYDWDLLADTYTAGWLSESNCVAYATIKRAILEKKRRGAFPQVSAIDWTLILEMVTTGIFYRIWDSAETAVENYLKQKELINSCASVTTLQEFILGWIERNYIDTNLNPVSIPAKFLSQEIQAGIEERLVLRRDVTDSEIRRVMGIAGYAMDMKTRVWLKVDRDNVSPSDPSLLDSLKAV